MPKEKIIIGAAFYGREWENVSNINKGLYQAGKFKKSESIRRIDEILKNKDYQYYWDDTAQAPFLYNLKDKLFITFDDRRSILLKTKYVKQRKIGGIMFWELSLDYTQDGLLDEIYKEKMSSDMGSQ